MSKDFGSTGFSDKLNQEHQLRGNQEYMSERKPSYYSRKARLDLDVIDENEDDDKRQSQGI